MRNPFSLLVVDVSEGLEEALKAQERGYFIDMDYSGPGRYVRGNLSDPPLLKIQYPHGSVRAGLDAIIDTARIAHERGVPTYAVHYYYDGWTDGEEQTCHSLQPYIHEANRYEKYSLSAFTRRSFATRLAAEGCKHLMVIGYDRDDCVLETIRDAVERGITVVTSELCMLTQNRYNRQESSLAYFRKNTVFLEKLPDVWNYIVQATDQTV